MSITSILSSVRRFADASTKFLDETLRAERNPQIGDEVFTVDMQSGVVEGIIEDRPLATPVGVAFPPSIYQVRVPGMDEPLEFERSEICFPSEANEFKARVSENVCEV